MCAYLCYLAQHPSIRFDAHFIAFLTVKDYAAVEEAIKSDSEDLKVPVASSEDAAVNDKIRLYFVGQVPIDTRYRKVIANRVQCNAQPPIAK